MEDHPKVGIKKHEGKYNWMPDFVYGGIDGAITTFAVVAGVEGASLSTAIILILGFANLLADGFSMAVGKYLSEKSNKELYEKIQQIEFKHLKEKPEHEAEEVREIFALYGFKGKDLSRATKIVTSSPKAWVDLMMKNEFRMCKENMEPVKGGLATLISFVLIGFIPLAAYTIKPLINLTPEQTFIATCIATLSGLFIVGAVKSKFSEKNWIWSGFETAAIGGLAATVAYFVGFLLKGLAG